MELPAVPAALGARRARHASAAQVDLLKITNYLKLEGPRNFFIVEAIFVTNLIGWLRLRLYDFPKFVIWDGVLYGARDTIAHALATGYRHPSVAPFPPERLHLKGRVPSFSVGGGDFDLWADLRLNPTSDYLKLYWTAGGLLSALLVMHVIWYLMFWRILYRMLTNTDLHEAGEKVYEGESDDEDKED